MKYNIAKKFDLILMVVGLILARLMLTPNGHFHMQDELRYRYTFAFIREASQLDFLEALKQLFQFPLYARPLLVIFNLPTALLQVLFLVITGIKTEAPISLSLASAVQAIAVTGISLVVYKIAQRYLKSAFLALGTTIVFSLLINTNLYIRHILPYDTVLLVYLAWLYLVLTKYSSWSVKKLTLGSAAVAGLLHLVYPAFYLFGIIFGWLTMFLGRGRWFFKAGLFAVTVVAILVLTDFVSRIFGGAYFQEAKFVTSRVIIGSPQETPLFLFHYLWQVEGWIGKLLTIGFGLFLGHIILWHQSYSKEFKLLTAGVVLSYFIHGLSGPLAGKVFYGRSVHMFFWFVVLGVFMLVKQLKQSRLKNLIGLGIIIVSMASFVDWYPSFLKLEYPGDVLFYRVGPDYGNRVSQVNENYAPESKENHPVENAEYLAINFGRTFFPEAKIYEYDTKGGELIFQAAHPINFKAYQFEGLTPQERELIRARDYQMKLYKLQ
jgi:hypothetical protein